MTAVSLPAGGGAPPIALRRAMRVPLLTRVYVWSLVFDPLLFFAFADRSATGVTTNLSRILQAVVVAGLMLRAAARITIRRNREARLPDPWSPLYINYILYLQIAALGGMIGLI